MSPMQPYSYGYGIHPWWTFVLGPLMPLLLALFIFDIVLRGIALWRSARNYQKYWFVALLIINSVGLLPIFYLAFFQKARSTPESTTTNISTPPTGSGESPKTRRKRSR